MSIFLKERFIIKKVPEHVANSNPVWFHCASVGEFNTARILIKRIRERGNKIVVTYFSPRAHDFMERVAKKEVDWISVLPADLPYTVERFNKLVSPKVLIVVEREFWPFLLGKTKVPKLLINAYAKGSFMERLLIGKFDTIIARSDKDKEIFMKEGARYVKVCGNLKFVFEAEESTVEGNGKVFVAGSTHEGEETFIFELYARLKEMFGELKLVIAPRHISRSSEVIKIAESFGFEPVLRSDGRGEWEVLILDTLGELKSFYKIASLAFVGGTLVPVGGHNIAEPCRYDVPVLYGQYTHKVEDMVRVIEEMGMGFRIHSVEEAFKVCKDVLDGKIKLRKGLMVELSKNIEECYLKTILSYI